MVKRLALMVLLVFILSACRSSAPVTTAMPTVEVENPVPATSTPAPSPLPPTETPVPPTNTPLPTATSTPQPYGPDNFPANVNPLTGQEVGDPDLLERRPLAVKIQIYPRGQRPPWGVSLADIVFDYYQNNGLTRLIAIFYGQNAEQVGPIRSGRLFDGNVVSMYKAVFAFGGADRRILNRLYSSDFSDRLVLEGARNCPPMCRIEPNTFNYLVANTEELSKYATANDMDNERQDLNGMYFHPQAAEGGEPGEQIFTRYSISAYSRWDYDPGSGRYLRFQDNQEDNGQGEVYVPLIDRLDNQQAAADNVVVLLAPHSYFYRSGNSEIIEIGLQAGSSGTGYAFRDGQYYKVKWERPANGSLLSLTLEDGSPYPFKPGTTWFQVTGQSTGIEEEPAGVWRFTSSIP